MGHFDGFRQRVGKADEAAFIASGFRQFEQTAFRIVDLLGRRHVDRSVKGDIDHVLADPDQVPAQSQIVDRAAIVFRIDDGGRIGGKTQEELGRRQVRDLCFGRKEGLERDRRCCLSRADQLTDLLVDVLMRRDEEVIRFQEIRNPVISLVVDQNGTQQLSFRLRVMRRQALYGSFRFDRLQCAFHDVPR